MAKAATRGRKEGFEVERQKPVSDKTGISLAKELAQETKTLTGDIANEESKVKFAYAYLRNYCEQKRCLDKNNQWDGTEDKNGAILSGMPKADEIDASWQVVIDTFKENVPDSKQSRKYFDARLNGSSVNTAKMYLGIPFQKNLVERTKVDDDDTPEYKAVAAFYDLAKTIKMDLLQLSRLAKSISLKDVEAFYLRKRDARDILGLFRYKESNDSYEMTEEEGIKTLKGIQ